MFFPKKPSVVLNVPFPRKELFKESFLYSAPVIWNSLPVNIRSAYSVAVFKRLYKHHFLSD